MVILLLLGWWLSDVYRSGPAGPALPGVAGVRG